MASGTRLPDGPLKKISEAKTVTAEIKNGPLFSFRCLTVPVLLTNNVISLADVSFGMQRRLMVVPFDRRFDGVERDLKLFDEIAATEMSGVLNRCIAGLKAVMSRHYAFQIPKAVKVATATWLNDANPVPAFIDECCIRDSKGVVPASLLYENYINWALGSGVTFRQQFKAFIRNVKHLGFENCKRKQGATFIGLRLK